MRFVLAIAAFVVAAAMIVVGIAQRTVFLPPAAVTYETHVDSDAPFIVVDGDTMTALPGKQSVTASGSDTVFVGYGRTADVKAWLGDQEYTSISFDKDQSTLVASQKKGKAVDGDEGSAASDETDAKDESSDEEETAPNPKGSDLWLMESVEKDAVIAPMNVPEGVSVIIASDGDSPAPADIKLTWPSDNSTPWAGPLIVGGIVMIAVGILLYILGFTHMRRSRGPRRKGNDVDEKPRKLRAGPKRKALGSRSQALRRSRIVLPMLVVGALGLSGCSQAYWPDFTPDHAPAATPSPTETGDAEEQDAPAPAVSQPQLERIMSDVSSVASEADSSRDADLAETRFSGAALDARKTNYKVRDKESDYPAPEDIPAAPLSISLPQATDTWPRTVMVMVKDDDPKVAPTAVVLQQNDPRSNYKVEYTQQLEPKAVVPELASAGTGAASIPPDSAWLRLAPQDLADAYADVVDHGDDSDHASEFDTDGDALLKAIKADRKKKKKELEDNDAAADISFSTSGGEATPRALTTLNSGGLVAVNIIEEEVVKPSADRAVVKVPKNLAALAGVDETTKGLKTTYSDQLLFYVPPADSDREISLLGFSQGLLSASEL